MKELPLQRLWTGDGRGATDAVTHTQIKRTETVAMYSVTNKDGVVKGYEVFIIKKRLKGQPLPGGLFEEEDREVYPSANSFGRIAWAPGGLTKAEQIYNNLVNGKSAHDSDTVITDTEENNDNETMKPVRPAKVKPNLTIPIAEFTVGELAEQNGVQYPIAFVFVKEAIEKNIVKFVREERRNAKGKASKIYQKL